MVTHYGIGNPGIRTRRDPGDLRWPARRVVVALALYLAAAWAVVSVGVMFLM